jgi:hypothetical protein
VNPDLFFLLALQQACKEEIVNLHYPPVVQCGVSSHWFALLRLQVVLDLLNSLSAGVDVSNS